MMFLVYSQMLADLLSQAQETKDLRLKTNTLLWYPTQPESWQVYGGLLGRLRAQRKSGQLGDRGASSGGLMGWVLGSSKADSYTPWRGTWSPWRRTDV